MIYFHRTYFFLKSACYSCGWKLREIWPSVFHDVLWLHETASPDCIHLTEISLEQYEKYSNDDFEYEEEKRETGGVLRYPGLGR